MKAWLAALTLAALIALLAFLALPFGTSTGETSVSAAAPPGAPASTPSLTPTPTAECPPQFHVVPAAMTRTPIVLNGVSGVSVNDMWAVGQASTGNVIEHWNGSQWSIPSPTPFAGFTERLNSAASIASNDVWAVGWYEGSIMGTLAYHWNGTQWTNEYSHNGYGYWNELMGVDGVASNDVWAVGYQAVSGAGYHTLIEHWNGSSWAVIQSPDFSGYLNAVSVRSATDIWAAGYSGAGSNMQPLILHSDGLQWSSIAPPAVGLPSRLLGVVGIEQNDAWAVGYATSATSGLTTTLTLRWDGVQWGVVESPNPGSNGNRLNGVDALAPNDVWAVGYRQTGTVQHTLALHWDGYTWSEIPSPDQGDGSTFNAIKEIAANQVWAVGSWSSSGTTLPLTELYSDASCPSPSPSPSPTSASVSPTATSTPETGSSPTPYPSWTAQPSATATPPISTPTPCDVQFSDVGQDNVFYPFIRCMACRGFVTGYDDGTFRPNSVVTRGQICKMVVGAAEFNDPIPSDRQTFQDVPPTDPFWLYIERLVARGYITGYPCGRFPAGPCVPPQNRAYFLPNNPAIRGQICKIVSNAAGFFEQIPPDQQHFQDIEPGSAFWPFIERLASRYVIGGYECGGPGEPCVPPQNRAYFRQGNLTTRGQASKIVANTFLPNCYTPDNRR